MTSDNVLACQKFYRYTDLPYLTLSVWRIYHSIYNGFTVLTSVGLQYLPDLPRTYRIYRAGFTEFTSVILVEFTGFTVSF